MSDVRVRPARPEESAILAEMANDLNDHVGVHGRPFTPERVRAGAFGPEAAFTPLVAELEGAVAGYAFFTLGYNTDVAARAMWLHDIFVTPAARGRGVGAALMAAVAGETVRAGGTLMEWGVHTANAGALEFYRRLGAVAAETRIMGVGGERLHALAAAAGEPARAPADDLDTLQELNRNYIRSVRVSDVRWFEEHLAGDFLNTNPDGSLVDRAGFLAQIARQGAVANLEADDVDVRMIGEVAIIHARTTYKRPDGQPGAGRYTDIWTRRQGRWLCVAAHVTRG
jgi:GNAT superfamily N-acetyltransferase